MNVCRTPRIVVIEPGIGPRLDGHEPISAIFVRQRAARPAEVWIEWRRVLVPLMQIAACGIRLPDLDQGVRYRTSVVIQYLAGDDDALALRLSRMLAREGIVGLR